MNGEDLGTRLSCFGCENKKWQTFHLFQEYIRTRENTWKLKSWQEQQEDNSYHTMEAEQPKTRTIKDNLNIDGSMEVSMF